MCNCESVLEYIDLFTPSVFIHSTNIYPAPTKNWDLWPWSQVIKLCCEEWVKRVWVPQPLRLAHCLSGTSWKGRQTQNRKEAILFLESQGQQCSHLSWISSFLQPERINQSRTEDRRSVRLRGEVMVPTASVQSLSHVQLLSTPWTAARQASLSTTNSWGLLKLMSIESVMPFNHLILCHPLLLLPSIFTSIRVFSNESVLCIRWSKYCSFSFSISPSNEYSGLILDRKISQEKPRTENSFPGN